EDRERPGAVCTVARRMRREWKPPSGTLTVENARTERPAILKAFGEGFSRFEAPWTVEVHAYRQPAARRLVLHLVNYNHKEKAPGKSVVEREAPIAAEPATIRLRLPEKFRARSVRFLSPDVEREQTIEFRQRDGVLECRTPGFLVYGVCVVSE